ASAAATDAGAYEFPAPAGINRTLSGRPCVMMRVPRASGDKPRTKRPENWRRASSPRQRG
ncbi:hypothetical protein NXZ26_26240, partial [Escherichia coli]|nr:hypothetical protein [Escherichia coli]